MRIAFTIDFYFFKRTIELRKLITSIRGNLQILVIPKKHNVTMSEQKLLSIKYFVDENEIGIKFICIRSNNLKVKNETT